MCKIFPSWFNLSLSCTTASYWSDRNGIIRSSNTKVVSNLAVRSYSFSPGYVGKYKCPVIGLCLLVCLWWVHIGEREECSDKRYYTTWIWKRVFTITLPHLFLVHVCLRSPPCFKLLKSELSLLENVVQILTPSSVNVALDQWGTELTVAFPVNKSKKQKDGCQMWN